MKKVIQGLEVKPDMALIDAEKVETKTDTNSIIKGDEKSISIAAASIIAKVSRDQYMSQQDKLYPQYYFPQHKGYGTIVHLKALKKHGPIKNFHRVSYKPIQKIIETLNKK
jgi:ribonuclease HII